VRIRLSAKTSIKSVDVLKANAARYEVRTELKGLILVVHPSGVKTYTVQYARGRRQKLGYHPVMTPQAALTQAVEFLRDVEKHGAPIAAKAKAATFEGFLKEHYEPWVLAETKSGKATVANLRAQFGPLFGNKPLMAITAWAIEKFKAKRIKDGIKPATVNRDLDRIRAALAKAVEWNLLSVNPLTTVKRSKVQEEGRVRYLDAAEETRLRKALVDREGERRRLRANGNAWAAARGRETRPEWAPDAFTDHLAPLVMLALNTGLRRGELFGLTWEAVDVPHRQLKVAAATAKSRRTRHVPLNSEALDVIQRLRKHATGVGLVFPGASGARMTHINRSWGSLVKAAMANTLLHQSVALLAWRWPPAGTAQSRHRPPPPAEIRMAPSGDSSV